MRITRNQLAIAVMVIGLGQMAGYLLGSRAMRGLGLASGFSPFPRVFCATGGHEAFAATHELEWRGPDGVVTRRKITPEWYQSLGGPYNRRNVHGAVIAFAPAMDPDLRDAVFASALAPGSPLRIELGIPGDATGFVLHITPRAGERAGPWKFDLP